MNYLITGIFCFFLLPSNGQFLEINEVVTSPCIVTAKDYQGFLYGTKAQQVFRKSDNPDSDWEVVLETPYSGISTCITDRKNFPKYIYNGSGVIQKSDNGINWVNHSFNNITGTFRSLQYIDNGDLFLCTSSNTYRSTNGGITFSLFLPEGITAIEFDAFTNRFIYTKRSSLTTIDVHAYSLSSSSSQTIETGIPFAEYVRQFISISKEGTFFMTGDGAFDYIYAYQNGSAPSNQIYPVGGSYPLHTRALVSTQTGRTWVGSWGFGLTSVEDDTLHYNYNRPTQYQYMCESMFLDRDGYLYYSYSSQNVPVGYIKSAYSVRQPVFFERMETLESAGESGVFMRISNDRLMCLKTDGKTYTSSDNGDSWEYKEDLIPNQSATLTTFSQHPDGTFIYGNHYGANFVSTDTCETWVQNSAISGRLSDIAHSATGEQSLLIYTDQVCLSNDTLQSKSTLLTTVTTHPVYGTIALFSTGLITSQNTFIVAGRINESYVKRSVDGGATWEDILPDGIYHQHIWDLYEDDQNQVWLASDSGLFVSINDGLTWTKDEFFPGKAHYIIQNSSGELVVTDQAGTSNSGSTYVLRNNQWKRISYGHTAGMKQLYLDPVSNRMFGSGTYRSIAADEQDILSVEENINSPIGEENHILIYPNPVSNYLTVHYKNTDNPSILVFDIKGQLVIESKLQNNQLDVSELETGIYTIVLQSDSGIGQGKFVKY